MLFISYTNFSLMVTFYNLKNVEDLSSNEKTALITNLNKFLRLKRVGFPTKDARSLSGLMEDNLFEAAQKISGKALHV